VIELRSVDRVRGEPMMDGRDVIITWQQERPDAHRREIER
jgi:hypothetical protein